MHVVEAMRCGMVGAGRLLAADDEERKNKRGARLDDLSLDLNFGPET